MVTQIASLSNIGIISDITSMPNISQAKNALLYDERANRLGIPSKGPKLCF